MITLTYTFVNNVFVPSRELTPEEQATVTSTSINLTNVIYYQGDEPANVIENIDVARNLLHVGEAGSLSVVNPSSGATVYVGEVTTLTPNATATSRQFQLPTGMLRRASFFVDPTSLVASTEDVTINLRNITDSVTTLLGTIKYDVRGKTTFSGELEIAVDSSKYYSVQYVYPTFTIPPLAVLTRNRLFIYES